jgi:hypothetical protein
MSTLSPTAAAVGAVQHAMPSTMRRIGTFSSAKHTHRATQAYTAVSV